MAFLGWCSSILIMVAAASAPHTDGGGNVAQYLGIPYAQQPVRRFERAVMWEGQVETLLNATAEGRHPPPPPCPQVREGSVTGTEDCLYLNVWTPTNSEYSSPSPLKPVLVFIHGGSFILGGIDSPLLQGANLAAEEDVVVVTIAYRLGALGFLTDPGLPNHGNLALADQQLALEWVHRHIHLVGGDASRITLGGESAGAYSACLHMLVPASSALLRAVVLESGGCVALPLSEGLARTRAFAQAVGCPPSSPNASARPMLDCLRRRPVEALVQASTLLGQDIYHYWNFVVDGETVPASPAQLMSASGRSGNLSVLLGFNQDEGTLFVPVTGLDEDDSDEAFLDWVRTGRMELDEGLPALTPAQREDVLRLYPPTGGHNQGNVASLIADVHYKCPSYFVAGQHPCPASFFYRFQYFQKDPCNAHADLGAFHGSELPYVWGHPCLCPCQAPAFTPAEDALSQAMQRHWGAFVRAAGASPNDPEEEGVRSSRHRRLRRRRRSFWGDLVEWPVYQDGGEGGKMLQLDAGNITVVGRDLEVTCAFWDATDVYSK